MSKIAKNKERIKNKNQVSDIFKLFLQCTLWLYVANIMLILPLYFTDGLLHIGSDKFDYFKKISVPFLYISFSFLTLYLIIYLIEEKNTKQVLKAAWTNARRSDLFLALYGISITISYFGSDYKSKELLWGYEGWHMGYMTHMILILFFYLISRFVTVNRLFITAFLLVTSFTYGLGILNRFTVFPIDMKIETPSFISTIGNINWFCGYITATFFIGVYLLWAGIGNRYLTSLYVILGSMILVGQGSLSGYLATAGIIIFGFVLSAKEAARMKGYALCLCMFSTGCMITYILRHAFPGYFNFINDRIVDMLTFSVFTIIFFAATVIWLVLCIRMDKRNKYPAKLMTIVSYAILALSIISVAGFVALIIVNTKNPGRFPVLNNYPIFYFDWMWGSKRGGIWRAGIQVFMNQNAFHRLFGVGPDMFAPALYQGNFPETVNMVKSLFGEATLTNCHSEYFTLLLNTGICGLVTFIGFQICIIREYLSDKQNGFASACALCLLGYMLNNIVSFETAINITTIFTIISMGRNVYRKRIL